MGLLLAAPLTVPAEQSPAITAEQVPALTIGTGRTVAMEYTLKLEDGQTVDTNVGGKPLVFEMGKQQILPALEQALAGLTVNDRKSITLSPEQGYGVPDPKALKPVPLSQLPLKAHKVGARLVVEDPEKNTHLARVHQIENNIAVLDLNHPLVGQTLHFDVRILDIK